MHRRIDERSTGKSAQFAIAAFDELGTLPSFLEERDEARSGSDALLKICGIAHVGKDAHRARGAGGPHLVNLYTIKLDS
jgi:hypothetical protein